MQTFQTESDTTQPAPLLTRPLPNWLNETNFLWTVASVIALAAGLYLLLAHPVLSQTWDADHLTTSVDQKNDYNYYKIETDPAGQRFVWTQPSGALFVVPATTHTSQPLKIVIRARGVNAAGGPTNPTTVTANGVVIGTFTPVAGQAAFQDFTFQFKPAYRDDSLVRLTFDTPAWKPPTDTRQLGFALQSVTVDLQDIWSPLEKRAWLLWLWPVLALLGLASWVGQRRLKSNGTANILGYVPPVISLAIAALMAVISLLIMRVEYNGLLNQYLYWLYIVCSLYLTGFTGWLALAGLSWGGQAKPSLWKRAALRTAGWRQKQQAWFALGTIFLFNLGLSVLYVGKVVLDNGNIAPIFRYLDGPEYIFIAHGFYDPHDTLLRIPDFGQHSTVYWTAHFPGFPLLLMLVQPVVGWLWSPLVVNFVVSTLFAWVFYLLVRDFGYARYPLWMGLVALVLPIRWLIYHNVGSSEPVFMLFEVLSFYWFKKQRYWLAGLAGVGAVFSRPPGLFLWVGYMLFLLFQAVLESWNANNFSLGGLWKRLNWRAFWGLLLLPLGLVGVFGLYAWRYGDILAYFKITENVTHVGLIPFPTMLRGDPFNSPAVILTYLMGAVGLILLWRQRRFDLFWVGISAYIYTLFLLHNDILRYSMPFFFLIVLIPFAEFFSGRVARWLAVPVLIAIFFYSWGQLINNLADLDVFGAMQNILQIVIK